jgi:hypothetical protein
MLFSYHQLPLLFGKEAPGRDGPFVSRGRPSQFRRSEDSSLLHAEERKGAFETVMGQAAFVSSKTGTRTPPEETN